MERDKRNTATRKVRCASKTDHLLALSSAVNAAVPLSARAYSSAG